MEDADLHVALQHAEKTGEWGPVITLYEAAAIPGSEGEAFNLTHAFVHALEAGDPHAAVLKARLVGLRADVPD